MPNATVNQARSLRRRSTRAEVKLGHRLRDRRFGGHKFLRRVPIGPSIADLVCRERNLIVELDGSGHGMMAGDAERDRFLANRGFSVLRFWNPEVTDGINQFCETIVAALEGWLEPIERFLKASH